MNREQMVEKFHEATGAAVNAPWTLDLLRLRFRLLNEEMDEVNDVLDEMLNTLEFDSRPPIGRDLVINLLKELADLQVVLSGTAVALGLPLDEAFTRVCASNMSKLGDHGKPILRDDGKILKGPNYRPPILEDLV